MAFAGLPERRKLAGIHGLSFYGTRVALRRITPSILSGFTQGTIVSDSHASHTPPPLAPGIFSNLRFDALAGFLVFLIAMPLCLAIASASEYPPICGIWTAVIGGIVTGFISNSELTIKGPAAGLIVISVGAVVEFRALAEANGISNPTLEGYRMALGIGVAAGIIQIIFGLIRAGKLVDFFPLTPVHGMLASIGIVIIAKQVFIAVGTTQKDVGISKEAKPLEVIMDIPKAINHYNPEIMLIGIIGLVILFTLPLIPLKAVKRVPGQLIVLIVAIALGFAFDLSHKHTYLFPPHLVDENVEYSIDPDQFLVTMPDVIKEPEKAFFFPRFDGLATGVGIQYLVLFCLIGSLESLLSAKAIELLDPWRRKTNFNRDLLAIGIANTAASAIGGLPMISEIVRSKANIDNGARTRVANGVHGLCLLAFVLLFPQVIHSIPNAALAAMLIFTGFRLASPKEFLRTYKLGSEQFIVFVGTILVTLATDLLIGIAAGVALEVIFHLWHGAPITGMWKSDVEPVPEGDNLVILVVRRAAVFSNWLGIRGVILKQAEGRDKVVIDLSQTRLVDHSVMEKLHQLELEFTEGGKELSVIGLEEHTPLARDPLAARKNRKANSRSETVPSLKS